MSCIRQPPGRRRPWKPQPLEAPAPVHTEIPAPVIPQPTVAEILDQHLDHAQQKKIAYRDVEQNSIPDYTTWRQSDFYGGVKSPAHREIVEASLKTLLGERPDNAPYLSALEGIGEKLGLTSGSDFVQIDGRGAIKMLAEVE